MPAFERKSGTARGEGGTVAAGEGGGAGYSVFERRTGEWQGTVKQQFAQRAGAAVEQIAPNNGISTAEAARPNHRRIVEAQQNVAGEIGHWSVRSKLLPNTFTFKKPIKPGFTQMQQAHGKYRIQTAQCGGEGLRLQQSG